MPCYVEPAVNHDQYLKLMLCKACTFLTKEQMQSINPISSYQNLYHWYLEHLLIDYSFNLNDATEMNRCKKEAERLGAKIIIEINTPILEY